MCSLLALYPVVCIMPVIFIFRKKTSTASAAAAGCLRTAGKKWCTNRLSPCQCVCRSKIRTKLLYSQHHNRLPISYWYSRVFFKYYRVACGRPYCSFSSCNLVYSRCLCTRVLRCATTTRTAVLNRILNYFVYILKYQ